MKKILFLVCIALFACNFLNAQNSRAINGETNPILCGTYTYSIDPPGPGCTITWHCTDNLIIIDGQGSESIIVLAIDIGAGQVSVEVVCGGLGSVTWLNVNVSGPTPTYDNYTTSGNMVIVTPSTIRGTFRINPYDTVIIATNISAFPNAEIIVHHGAKLILEGAIITSLCQWTWEGITVYGGMGTIPPRPNGIVIIGGGSTIENAVLGIDAVNGGQIEATYANFINNTYAVQIDADSKGTFIDSKFEINSSFFAFSGNNQPVQVILNGTRERVMVLECEFTTSYFPYTAIRAFDAAFGVDQSSYFGFRNAIDAYNSGVLPNIAIANSYFSANLLGVRGSATNILRIVANDFKLLLGNAQGINIFESTNYDIFENTFRRDSMALGTKGIVVENSGPAENIIYNNNFYDLEVGIHALGKNSDQPFSGASGLQFLCNHFEGTTGTDILVGDGTPADHSVRRNQGSNAQPAGNRFATDPCSGRDYNLDNHSAYTIYYHFDYTTPEESLCLYSGVNPQGTSNPSGCPSKGKSGLALATEVINEEEYLDRITVAPNPTTGQLAIKNEQLIINGVEVFDIVGRKLLSFDSLTSFNTTLDISHLNSGIYFIKIVTESGVVVKKVVKQ